MLGAYQLEQARRNLAGYAIFGVPPGPAIGVRLSGDPISWQDAVTQAVNAEGNDIDPRDRAGWLSLNDAAWPGVLQSGQMNAAAFSPNCVTQPAPSLNIFQTVSGLAIGTTAAGIGILAATHSTLIAAGAIPVIGAVIAGAGVVISIVDMIIAHHAAAVKLEQQLGCAAIAASNNAISLIDQAVANGQMRPADAAAGLDALYQKVAAYVAPAVKHNPCNANCTMLIELKAIVLFKKSQYLAMAAQQKSTPVVSSPAPAQPVTSSAGAPAQPGTGSSGSGPSPAPAVSSGSTLVLPTSSGGLQVQPAPGSAPQTNWLMVAALVAGGFAIARFV
jgi:hypothetical protein